jgi:uncharacterized membrane protein YoaK (UPF0700 family)
MTTAPRSGEGPTASQVNSPAGPGLPPLLERTSSASALALVAGLLNAWTFGNAQTFATVQSGNIVTLGYELVAGNTTRAATALVALLAFVGGSFMSMIVILVLARLRRPYSVPILLFEALAIIALAASAGTGHIDARAVAWIVSFIAGVQGNAFHRESGMLYGNVAVTFVLQSVGSLLARAAGRAIASDQKRHLRPAGEYALVLVAFAVGGAAGFAADRTSAELPFYVAASILGALALAASLSRGPIDPTGDAPTP